MSVTAKGEDAMAQSQAHLPLHAPTRPKLHRTDALGLPASAFGPDTARLLLTVLASLGMATAGFLAWFNGAPGTHLAGTSFVRPPAPAASFVSSAGAVAVWLGVATAVGLLPRMGWLARLAGAGAVLGFGMFAVSAFRSGETGFLQHVDVGAWLMLLAGIAAISAGLLPREDRSG